MPPLELDLNEVSDIANHRFPRVTIHIGVVVWCSGLSERFHRGDPGSIPPRAWSSKKGCSVVVDGFAISGKS